MPYLDLLGAVLEDVWAVRNRTVFTEALFETRDHAVHLVDLVLQVQRRISSAEKTPKKINGTSIYPRTDCISTPAIL